MSLTRCSLQSPGRPAIGSRQTEEWWKKRWKRTVHTSSHARRTSFVGKPTAGHTASVPARQTRLRSVHDQARGGRRLSNLSHALMGVGTCPMVFSMSLTHPWNFLEPSRFIDSSWMLAWRTREIRGLDHKRAVGKIYLKSPQI